MYAKAFERMGISTLVPSSENQKAVIEMIYDGVKAGNYSLDTSAFLNTMIELLNAGAQTLILGCTELPLAFQMYGFDLPHIDPTLALAVSAVKYAGHTLKKDLVF